MTLKLYEVARRSLEPFLPPLYKQVRVKLLGEIAKLQPGVPTILDVGGRKSPYTIGLPAHITIIDLPRSTELQSALNLGIDESIAKSIKTRRSNIDRLILGDMNNSGFATESFDLVVSVEVLEHVEDDERFVSEVNRVLKPGGSFIMTTPNGDYVENQNPDHKRHYTRHQLFALLQKHFENVRIEYAIVGGRYRKVGLMPWSLNRPMQTVSSAFGNVVNSFQSSRKDIKDRAIGTYHLIAVAEKS